MNGVRRYFLLDGVLVQYSDPTVHPDDLVYFFDYAILESAELDGKKATIEARKDAENWKLASNDNRIRCEKAEVALEIAEEKIALMREQHGITTKRLLEHIAAQNVEIKALKTERKKLEKKIGRKP